MPSDDRLAQIRAHHEACRTVVWCDYYAATEPGVGNCEVLAVLAEVDRLRGQLNGAHVHPLADGGVLIRYGTVEVEIDADGDVVVMENSSPRRAGIVTWTGVR